MTLIHVEGRTWWKRFIAVFVLSLFAVGTLMLAMARGAIGASFAVADPNFKISAGQLRGSGFAQFGSVDQTNGTHPAAVTVIKSASIDNFCQSVVARSVPGIGDISVVVRATGPDSVQANNLVVNIADLAGGKVSFHDVNIGLDVDQLRKGTPGVEGAPESFAQQADRVVLDNVRITAWRTTASTLTLNKTTLTVTSSSSGCF